jgi:hypothetical protein
VIFFLHIFRKCHSHFVGKQFGGLILLHAVYLLENMKKERGQWNDILKFQNKIGGVRNLKKINLPAMRLTLKELGYAIISF